MPLGLGANYLTVTHLCATDQVFLSLNELLTTETELRAMAAAANTGLSKIPKKGNNTPAARGIPRLL